MRKILIDKMIEGESGEWILTTKKALLFWRKRCKNPYDKISGLVKREGEVWDIDVQKGTPLYTLMEKGKNHW